MNINIEEVERLNKITEKVIGCAFTISNTLGAGFIEKVYENALAHELVKAGLKVEKQASINVFYDGLLVGEFAADLMVERNIIVELKVVKALDEIHSAQCRNYL
jgi:GxxExxY protein